MKRLFIITDYFPPNGSTAAERPAAWFKYLPQLGYYPIVLTRKQSENCKNVEKFAQGEVHYIDIPQDPRKTINNRKFSTLFKYVAHKLNDMFYHYSPFNSSFKGYENYLLSLEIPKGSVFLITLSPFYFLRLAKTIEKKIGGKCILDYRDDWSTSEIKKPYHNFSDDLLNSTIFRRIEKKFLKYASGIISVSDYYVSKIQNLAPINTPSLVLHNGYNKIDAGYKPALSGRMSFVYVGSLYPMQDIVPFVRALHAACETSGYMAKMIFLGSGLSSNVVREMNLLKSKNLTIEMLPRMPQKEALELQVSCHYGVMTPHLNTKGVPSSKLYIFLGLQQPVFLFPSDNDVIEKTLLSSNLGVVANTAIELEKELISKLSAYHHGKWNNTIVGDDQVIKGYSRENQTKILAQYLNQFF